MARWKGLSPKSAWPRLDGGTIRFRARAFDVNVGGRLPSEEKPKRFAYTDPSGREAPIYLRLDRVVAIVVTPAGTSTSER